jgi:sterol desaturase/sphingolipid hydroxylase (fatty acid hydroxylase superfamily)
LLTHLHGVVVDLLRLFIWLALLLALFGTAERLWPRHRQKLLRQAFGIDLFYYFLSGFAPRLLLVAPLSLLAGLLHHGVPSAYYAWMAEWPLALRLVVALVVADIGGYWGHRWAHQLPWLWRFHAVHHSAQQMDWLVNTRAHPLDMGFQRLCSLVPTYALGLLQPSAQQLDLAPLLLMVIGTGWGFFVHANLNWRLGWLEQLVSSPRFHHWHHDHGSAVQSGKNYAAMLPWLDRLFGTLYLPPRVWPTRYGTDTPVSPRLLRQLVDPFRPTPSAARPVGGAQATSNRPAAP